MKPALVGGLLASLLIASPAISQQYGRLDVSLLPRVDTPMKSVTVVHPVWSHVVRQGIVRPNAGEPMAAAWDTSRTARETAYCVTLGYRVAFKDNSRADSAYVVWSVEPAQIDSAGLDWVSYHCGPGVPTIHTHPRGGGTPNCDPSKPDRNALLKSRAPFDVIQCEVTTFRFYYPDDGS